MQKKTDQIQLSIDAEKDWQNSTLIYGKKKKKSLQGMGIEKTFELIQMNSF